MAASVYATIKTAAAAGYDAAGVSVKIRASRAVTG